MRLAFESLTPTEWFAWLVAPLFGAAKEANHSMVRKLVEEGAGQIPDVRYGLSEKTVIHAAVEGGEHDVVRLLLEERADHDVNVQDRENFETPSMLRLLWRLVR